MALQKDISEICDVSISTVSKALHNKYSDVSPKTRERIRRVAKELDYHANTGGMKRRGNESGVISVLAEYSAEEIRKTYYRQMLWGMLFEAKEKGYDILLMPGQASRSGMSCLGRMVRRQPDGICLLCSGEYMMSDEVQEILHSDYPIVALENGVPGCSVIVRDDKRNAEILMEYLSRCGHSRIAFLGDSSLFSRRAAHYLMKASLQLNISEFRVITRGQKIDESCLIFDTVSHAAQWISQNMKAGQIPDVLSVAAMQGYDTSADMDPAPEPDGTEAESSCGERTLHIAHIADSPVKLGQEAVRNLLRYMDDPYEDLKEPIYVSGLLHSGNSVKILGA